ncbi:hypothetical protein BLOT_015905 [Blomia tropicalis]|nr:hypothetical protein BLOT_015905 [Blomia tropicalis]
MIINDPNDGNADAQIKKKKTETRKAAVKPKSRSNYKSITNREENHSMNGWMSVEKEGNRPHQNDDGGGGGGGGGRHSILLPLLKSALTGWMDKLNSFIHSFIHSLIHSFEIELMDSCD